MKNHEEDYGIGASVIKKREQIKRRDCLAWIRGGSGGILSVCVNT